MGEVGSITSEPCLVVVFVTNAMEVNREKLSGYHRRLFVCPCVMGCEKTNNILDGYFSGLPQLDPSLMF